ncbi:hypothetical protein PQZ37_00675 [bacterium]|jgi:hypothetical protein|nr:hypothetical protein [bacterium]|tara:strand:- start:243 stop:485 length:243 start_codon:yes stop_codon:yes gene_type:complete
MKKIITTTLLILFIFNFHAKANPMGEKVTKLGMSPKKIKKAGQECEDKGGVLLEIMAWKTVTLYGICVDKSALIQLTLDQ